MVALQVAEDATVLQAKQQIRDLLVEDELWRAVTQARSVRFRWPVAGV